MWHHKKDRIAILGALQGKERILISSFQEETWHLSKKISVPICFAVFFNREREKEREIFKCLFCQAKLAKLNCDHKPPNQNLNFENHKFFAVKMLVFWHFLKHTNWKLDVSVFCYSTGLDLKALMIYLIENSNFGNELKGIDLFTIIYFIYESLRHTN